VPRWGKKNSIFGSCVLSAITPGILRRGVDELSKVSNDFATTTFVEIKGLVNASLQCAQRRGKIDWDVRLEGNHWTSSKISSARQDQVKPRREEVYGIP